MRPRWTPGSGEATSRQTDTQQPRVPRGHGVWRVERAIAGFRRSGDRSDQVPPRSRYLGGEPAVSQAELEHVAHEYRHVHEEHRRARMNGRARRRLEVQLQRLTQRFERLLAEAPVSEADRGRWRDRLYGSVAAPPSRGAPRPLLFRGRSASGSELRLIAGPGGTVDAFVDGSAVAVLDSAPELATTTPGFVFALDSTPFRETFAASPASRADLRDALAKGRRPRRTHVRELIEDGIVDRTLAPTARGRRALALDVVPASHATVGAFPAITIRGPVRRHAREQLARALDRVAHVAPRPVLRITASLVRREDPALTRPVAAKATIHLSGRPVRVHAEAASENEAITLLESRLHRRLRALADHDLAERRGRPAPP